MSRRLRAIATETVAAVELGNTHMPRAFTARWAP